VEINEFRDQHCKDVDFLSIDTESTNMILFRNLPAFVFDQISLLCIEHDGYWEEIQQRLPQFTTLHINAENIILGK
jgi:hypothetical protein